MPASRGPGPTPFVKMPQTMTKARNPNANQYLAEMTDNPPRRLLSRMRPEMMSDSSSGVNFSTPGTAGDVVAKSINVAAKKVIKTRACMVSAGHPNVANLVGDCIKWPDNEADLLGTAQGPKRSLG